MTTQKFVELEKPAIWRPIRASGMSFREYKGAYPYMRRGVFGQSSFTSPVIRYAKNYKRGKSEYSLVIFTEETNQFSITEYFDMLSKKIRKDQVDNAVTQATMAHMTYLDNYYDKDKK